MHSGYRTKILLVILIPAKGEINKEEGDCQYYITSYFNGTLLIERIQQEGRIPESEAIGIFRGILDVLKYLHHQPVPLCHNDINPTNIILSSVDGSSELIDLGHMSERTGMRASHCSKIISALERRKFVCRSIDKHDKRQINIILTRAGRESLNALKKYEIVVPEILSTVFENY